MGVTDPRDRSGDASRRPGVPEQSFKRTGMNPIMIRSLERHEEFEECVRVQEAIWGRDFSERVPTAILKVSARLGGVIMGAFADDDRMVGFVFGITGMEDGRPVHWSDMLAVLPSHRGRGIGRRLKEKQREHLMALGVERVYWTFDPLEALNAHLNLMRLGGWSDEYVEAMYGASDSPLHSGIGTDRLVVTWDLTSPDVASLLSPRATDFSIPFPELEDAPMAVEGGFSSDVLEPSTPRLELRSTVLLLAVPSDIQGLKEAYPNTARRWRETTRQAFQAYLSKGWVVRGGLFSPDGNLFRYILIRGND